MRSLLLAAIVVLAAPACSDDITGGSGGSMGDDDGGGGAGGGGGGATCTCSDGTVLQGNDCATECPAPSSPSISLAVSQSSIGGSTPVELGVETDLTVTVTSVMGFSGPVTLAATAVGSDGTTAITDWTLALDNTSLSLSGDGDSASATLGVEAMGDTAALTGTIMVTATAGSAAPAAPIAVTFEPQLRVEFTDDGGAQGNCKYPMGHSSSADAWVVTAGRKIAVYDMSTTYRLIVHVDQTSANTSGFTHETIDNTGTAPGSAYISPPLTSSTPISFYCHGGTAGTFLQPGNSADYQYLSVP